MAECSDDCNDCNQLNVNTTKSKTKFDKQSNKSSANCSQISQNNIKNGSLLEEILSEKKLSQKSKAMTALSQRSGVTQLEFHQAMQDFKTMFPEMDEDVIEVVLRANNGAVDATIDQLLAMNLDSENERIRQELDTNENNEVPPRYSPATPPPSYHSLQSQAIGLNTSPNLRSHPKDKRAESNLSHQMSKYSTSSQNKIGPNVNPSEDSMRFKRQWNPPILGPLPHTFLRIEPDENQRKLSALTRPSNDMTVINSALLQQKMEENQRQRQLSISTDDPELAQFLEDERVAIFLQNEEFVRELRRNKDFMSTLELDTTTDGNGAGSPSGVSTHADSDAAFKETLKHMGKVSRRKFAQLARLFSRRRRRSFQQLLSEGQTPSRDNLLLREDQYHEFQNEGSDNEEVVRENPLVMRIDEREELSNRNIANNRNNSSINSSSFRTNHKI